MEADCDFEADSQAGRPAGLRVARILLSSVLIVEERGRDANIQLLLSYAH